MKRLSTFVSLLLFWLVTGGAAAVTAQSETPPIEAYWTRLSRLQLFFEQNADTLTEAEQRVVLLSYASEFEQESAYRLDSGAVVIIVPHPLLVTLRDDSPNLDVIRQQVDSLLALRDAWEGGGYSEADLALLDEVLSNPAFEYNTEPGGPTLRDRLLDWFFQVLEFFLRLVPEPLRESGILGNVLFYGGVIGLLLLLYFATQNVIKSFLPEATAPEVFDDEANLTADGALERAQQYSTGGDYRTAVRYLYLSALLLLEERGLLRYDRSLTNREYLRTIAHRPELSVVLRDVIEVFDRVWYGFQPLAAAEYNEYARRVETLKAQQGGM